MRSRLSLMLLLACLSAPAFADDREAAREAFREGSRQYDLGDFKSALAAFKRAYLNFEDPVILFNIGQCQRQLGDKVEALRSYRVFLSKTPNTPERAQVEKVIADLQAAIDQEKTALSEKPKHVAPPAEKPPVATPLVAPVEKPLEKPVVEVARPKSKKWVWGVVAGGVVLVAGAITLGVVLGTRHDYIELKY